MRAIILAGGPASQEPGLPRQVPRPLWPVLTRPIVQNLIDRLVCGGVTSVTLCANGRTEIFVNRLADQHQQLTELRFSEDPLPRGPAGCVKDNADFLDSSPFIIANAACWLSDDASWLIDQHCRHQNQLTVFCRPGTSVPSGIYVCNPSVLRHIPDVGYYDIKEQLIPQLVDSHCKVGALPLRGFTHEAINTQSYMAIHHYALMSLAEYDQAIKIQAYQQRAPGVWIEPDSFIAKSARVFGPVMIGSSARIEDGAVVIGPTTLGANAVVGRNSIVTECAVWDHASIPPHRSFHAVVVPAHEWPAQRAQRLPRSQRRDNTTRGLHNNVPITPAAHTGG